MAPPVYELYGHNRRLIDGNIRGSRWVIVIANMLEDEERQRVVN